MLQSWYEAQEPSTNQHRLPLAILPLIFVSTQFIPVKIKPALVVQLAEAPRSKRDC